MSEKKRNLSDEGSPRSIASRVFSVKRSLGNFKTLAGNEKTIFFLFQSKCDVVSKELRLSSGSMLLKKS